MGVFSSESPSPFWARDILINYVRIEVQSAACRLVRRSCLVKQGHGHIVQFPSVPNPTKWIKIWKLGGFISVHSLDNATITSCQDEMRPCRIHADGSNFIIGKTVSAALWLFFTEVDVGYTAWVVRYPQLLASWRKIDARNKVPLFVRENLCRGAGNERQTADSRIIGTGK